MPIKTLVLKIGQEGYFEEADLQAPANVILTAGQEVFFAFIEGGSEKASQHVKVSGDVDLAQAVGQLATHLRWDVEEDLSKLIGDSLAHRVVQVILQGQHRSQAAISDLSGSVLEFLTHEKQILVTKDQLEAFKGKIRILRDDLDRLEKRIQRLN